MNLIGVHLIAFVLAVYGVGLRPFSRPPFLRLAAPSFVFDWVIQAATRSSLRKAESWRDKFVYREGEKPRPQDIARTQIHFIASFGVMLGVVLIAK
ncbi:MAG: hypothetical protein HC783_06440 [Rhodobacteraceae bacterium]|nr:hypothetical protein [Paracoccaceae bacterium]